MKRLLIIPLLLLSLTLGATKYYVDQAGNDGTGDGSSGNPWALVSYACTQASAGDTVYVNAGTINQGTTQIVKPVGVSITGAGVTSIILTSYTNASSVQAAIQCASTSGTTTDDNSSISYIKLSGNNYTSSRAIYIGYRNNINIHHLTIEGFNYTGIYANGSDGSTYPNLFLTGIVIQHCILNDNGSYIGADGYCGSIRLRGTDGADISYNRIKNDGREECNSHCFSTYRNRRLKIHDNTLWKRDQEVTSDSTEYWNFFLEEWNYKGGSEYYNNIHYGLAKFSLGGNENELTDGTTFGYKVYNNKWLNDSTGYRTYRGETDTKYCINVEGNGHEKVYVYGNYIQNFAWAIELSAPTSGGGSYWNESWFFKDIWFYYNIIDGVGNQDFAYNYGFRFIIEKQNEDYYSKLENIKFNNNTVIAANSGVNGFHGIGIICSDTVAGLEVKNNIFVGFTDDAIDITAHAGETLLITGLNITNNIFYNNGVDAVDVDATVTAPSGDVTSGNLTSNPLIKNSSTGRFGSNSPVIDAGIDVGLDYDYYGHKITGTPDIGAMEYGHYFMIEGR